MTISKEQWAEIETKLSGMFGRVELLCDGYKVSAVIEQGNMKLYIAVYVDGLIKGEWMHGKSEIPQKFHQERKRFVGSAKQRAWYAKQAKSKLWSKEQRAEYAESAKRTLSFWYPYWTNSKAFCRHIRKSCTSIEIVKIGY